ncbi:U20-hexatoxin-Hi1a-like isoform X2 [Parasteatoda tepidariorum]|uniref:U20-hexatoxin-Hi1a-like isoform X2 n=1 Tax=Parasteatoda tepidariorum TaxID=114398 RepID=UPI001C726382|nr:U24-ctenitoxin-Pn1a-like isoform X2 [Parasteatoda tepidariorum]
MKVVFVAVIATACLISANADSQCEEHRQRELESNAHVKLVPKCTREGDYEALQCFENSNFCMCWRPDGSHITDPSKKIKTCTCHVHKDRELSLAAKGIIGNFIPSCHEDGTYAKKQCHGSIGLCWCVDEDGKKVSESVRGDLEC